VIPQDVRNIQDNSGLSFAFLRTRKEIPGTDRNNVSLKVSRGSRANREEVSTLIMRETRSSKRQKKKKKKRGRKKEEEKEEERGRKKKWI
jgi:hypothetical protein